MRELNLERNMRANEREKKYIVFLFIDVIFAQHNFRYNKIGGEQEVLQEK